MNKYYLIILLFIVFSFQINAKVFDDIVSVFDSIKTIEMTFTKTVKYNNINEQANINYYNDKEKNLQRIILRNEKATINLYFNNDSIFMIQENTNDYYVFSDDNYAFLGPLLKTDIFASLYYLKDLKETDYKMWEDKKFKYIQFKKDTLSQSVKILYRINKNNEVDLLEMHDKYGNVILKTRFKMYKNGIPYNIYTELLQDDVIIEQILVKELKINSTISDSVLLFDKTNKKEKPLEDLFKQ